MKKNLLICVLISALVLSITACGTKNSGTASKDKDGKDSVKIGFANINEKATFGKLVKMGFEQECNKRGWELVYVDNNSDGQTAVTNAQILANNDVDFVVDLNVDQSVAGSILDTFNSAKIPVLAVDIALGDAPFFGIDSGKMGEMNGQYAAKYIKENWENKVDYVVLFTQIASGEEVQKRCRYAVNAMKDAGVEIGEVIEIESAGDTAQAQTMFSSFLNGHPDSKKIAVFTINENPATGAYAAAVTAKREWDIRIFSSGVGAQFVDPMYETQGNQSWVSSIACFPELYGQQVCKLIEDYLSTGKLNSVNDAKILPIDWSNIKEYYPSDNLPWNKLK